VRDGYLIEWSSPPAAGADPIGRWAQAAGPMQARDLALALPAPGAWQGLVRIAVLRAGAIAEVVATDLENVGSWAPGSTELPEGIPDLVLPPRSLGETRLQVVADCGSALAVAIRARLLSRRQVGRLLVSIERAFEETPPEVPRDACSA
jgi:hypothetical protein